MLHGCYILTLNLEVVEFQRRPVKNHHTQCAILVKIVTATVSILPFNSFASGSVLVRSGNDIQIEQLMRPTKIQK
jgi:hypothetical protein